MQQTFVVIGSEDDTEDICEQIQSMSYETEGKKLNKEIILRSMKFLFQNQRLGSYYKHLSRQGLRESEGSLFITYEYNLYDPHKVWWFQSVNVKKEFRQQKVFSRLFQQIEQLSFESKCPLKLYVELENTLAQKVYEKMGMKRLNEVIYEDDFLFHPFEKELRNNPILSSRMANIEDVTQIDDFFNNSISLNKNSSNIENRVERIHSLLEKTKQEGAIIFTYLNDKICSMISYFTEFSDWRCGLSVWIYDIRIKQDILDDISLQSDIVQHIMCYLKQLKLSLNVMCIRFILHPDRSPELIEIFKSFGLKESHYYIYEK